jgi:hypothetical protein
LSFIRWGAPRALPGDEAFVRALPLVLRRVMPGAG